MMHIDEKTYSQDIHILKGIENQVVPVPLYIAIAGHFKSRKHFSFRNSIHDCAAVHVVTSGRGIMSMDGVDYEVGAGDIFTFFPGKTVIYYDFPESPWRYYWFNFIGYNYLEAAGINAENPYVQSAGREVTGFCHKVFNELRDGKCSVAGSAALAWEFIDIVNGCRERGNQAFSVAESTRHLIDSEYFRQLSIEGIAKSFNVSRITLYRLFREKYGCSPKEYLHKVRLTRAVYLLGNSNSLVKEIAYSCGFNDPYYFSRIFKTYFKKSPEQWRKSPGEVPDF